MKVASLFLKLIVVSLLFAANTMAAATDVTLATTPDSPQPVGSSVVFHATNVLPAGPTYEYRYWLKTEGTWATVQDYSTNHQWIWDSAATGAAPGQYFIQVDVREVGTSVKRETAEVLAFTLNPQPATSVDLSVNPAGPQPLGTSITIDAVNVSPSGGNYEYRFWLKTGDSWSVVQNYSSASQWVWNTQASGAVAGQYFIQVDARSVGSSQSREAVKIVSYDLGISAPASAVTLSPALASPQITGTSVTFAATDVLPAGSYEYRFWLKNGSGWTMVQNYSPASQWVWDTAATASLPGQYFVQVDVRAVGSSIQRDTAKVVSYALTGAAATAVSLNSDLPSPQMAGNQVRFEAGNVLPAGGSFEYRFWLKSGGVWAVMQNYSSATTWDWNTVSAEPGSFFVQVDVRSVGSTVNREAAKVLAYTVDPAPPAAVCGPGGGTEVVAEVVAIDQTIVQNRTGAFNPVGMIFALRRDVIDLASGLSEAQGGVLSPGQVALRPDLRPRPLALRVNEGQNLRINFQNLLSPTPLTNRQNQAGGIQVPAIPAEQPLTRNAGVHINGMQMVSSLLDDGSNVGTNSSSLAAPGGTRTYVVYAEKEGTYLLNSSAANIGGEGNLGTQAYGLFGAVNVEKAGAEWYRSQLTRQEMAWATSATTADGHPIINYDAVYPLGHQFEAQPIVRMTCGDEIVHADLYAIITGSNRGNFPNGTYRQVSVYPNHDQAFREFTVIFHDEIKRIEAFPGFFGDPSLGLTLAPVGDGFAINYGTGGVGSEVIANRLGVGPASDCVECKYEEFFLTSWALGDPAMIVDVPANFGLESLTPGQVPSPAFQGPKATKAFYPSDPSNVWHSYMNDHVKIRNLHAGKEHHLFHLHSHQWLFSPDDPAANYLDAQTIGPGSGFTYEIAYNGSGNRNKTPGDAIFHCHFYPHFAAGMWGLWRIHDVLETGTLLDANGRPAPGSRALPDGEITVGTPIPAVVPIPTLPMAPLPQANVEIVGGQPVITPIGADPLGNPGYPFFLAGIAGHRPPTPPLDLVRDGGLPRHVITGGSAISAETPLSFFKELTNASAVQYQETGEPQELAAMDFHAQLFHDSFLPDGSAAFGTAGFETNGLPPVAGAPYAEPCRNDDGSPLNTPNLANRIYKAAVIQLDVQLNKVGWHFEQQRIEVLEQDVTATLAKTRPPEPFVMRANTFDCIDFDHTNLIPNIYTQDDFQVETPTDVVGQHIHLVKFDVTSADGAANGFNYEDGTLSPDEVLERMTAINNGGGLLTTDGVTVRTDLTPTSYLGHSGTRTTRQRWFVDPVLDNQGVDRGLGNVFTHDHFGPSTHQQAGLYGTLMIEPQGSTWHDPETGVAYNSRSDGGPTSWKADIRNGSDSWREFYIEFADFQLAYTADGKPVNPPHRIEVGLPDLLISGCPAPFPLAGPCPEAISASDPGTYVVNYRNEPLITRVLDDTNPANLVQTAGAAGDFAHAFESRTDRVMTALNTQPATYPPLTGDVGPGDPFTPIMRSYDGDKIRVRSQVGATEEMHAFSIMGAKWLQNFKSANSGWRNAQHMGISEWFTFEFPMLVDSDPESNSQVDQIYMPNSSNDGLWSGSWGLLRSYEGSRSDLQRLPNNPLPAGGWKPNNADDFNDLCPVSAPVRAYDVTAVAVSKALETALGANDGTLVYNSRPVSGGPLHDPTALIYVMTSDLDINGHLAADAPVEPLILRAAAGECIEVTLRNQLPATPPDADAFNVQAVLIDRFNNNDVHPSAEVGLHPQLVAYNGKNSAGINAGTNATSQSVAPGGNITYRWYAGDVRYDDSHTNLIATPVEFGGSALMPADKIKQTQKGLFGALVILPQGATWAEDTLDHVTGRRSRAQVTVTRPDTSSFRDFVMVLQSDSNLRYIGNTPLPPLQDAEDSEDSGHKGINYRTEPAWFRLGYDPGSTAETTRAFDFSNFLSNNAVGSDPETPIFKAAPGQEVRFHLVEPGGHNRSHVIALNGHIWGRQPYTDPSDTIGSTQIGLNPVTWYHGEQAGQGPANHFTLVPLNGAGGINHVPGDYLYRDMAPLGLDNGMWGVFRVQ